MLKKNSIEHHGMSNHPAYNVWRELRRRCECENHEWFPLYGGRGIKVCDEWSELFSSFWADMGDSYKKGLMIDRIDNDGNYCKENCRWVSINTSNTNKRVNGREAYGCTLFKKRWWRARIKIENKEYHIGYFKTQNEGIEAYKLVHKEWYGF